MVDVGGGGEVGRQVQEDLVAAASGGGGYCPEGIPVELGLLTILAAFGVAFGILYRALTVKTGRRRKRSDFWDDDDGSCEAGGVTGFLGCRMSHLVTGSEGSSWYKVADLLWHGESLAGRL